MSDEFKNLDDWMMKMTESERSKPVPEKDLKGFQESVMRKIAERQAAGPGMPYGFMVPVAAVSLAILLGVIVYLNFKPAPAIAPALKSEIQTTPVMASGSAEVSKPVTIPKAPVKVADIVSEIEALKELGVWTEADEEEAGIPVDVTFADLEVGTENSQPQITVTPVAKS